MSEEHDSWVEALGVSFGSSDASASMKSGLGEMAKSGLDAVGHVVGAGLDVARGVAEENRAVLEHVAAAGLDLVGAHGAADTVRNDAKAVQARAGEDFKAAGKELGEAADDVFSDAPPAPRPIVVPLPVVVNVGLPMQPDCKPVRGK